MNLPERSGVDAAIPRLSFSRGTSSGRYAIMDWWLEKRTPPGRCPVRLYEVR